MIYTILGGIGGTLLILTGLFILVVLFIDLDLKATASRIQGWLTSKSKIVVKQDEPVADETEQDTEEEDQSPPWDPPVTRSQPAPPPPPVIQEEPKPVTTVRKASKPIGIPLEEILPPREESVAPPEVVLHTDEFRTEAENFIPVGPESEKPEESGTMESGPAPVVTEDSRPETPAGSPSQEKQGLTFFRAFVKEPEKETTSVPHTPEKREEPVAEKTITPPVTRSETVHSEPPVPPPLSSEPKPIREPEPESHPGAVQTIPVAVDGEQEIELILKPTVEEQKAELPRDPIFKFGYRKPGLDLLQINPNTVTNVIDPLELEENARKLVHKLSTYGIQIDGKPEVTVGPRVTLFEIKPAEGIKVSRITALADDIALAMAARGIRIMAPIPGKPVVGVEIPNKKSVHVFLREILESEKFQKAAENGMLLPVAFGRTINNGIYLEDLAKLPHLLIAGTTGSGKSVGINTIICSLLYFAHPATIKFVMIDPKKIELSIYRRLEKHFLAVLPELDEPILTDTSKAVTLLRAVEREMDDRYTLLAKVGVRHLKDFNRKVESGEIKSHAGDPYTKLPFIVVIIDELADLMMTSGKEVEEPIARLAQLARAVGIHLVVATQRPSVDVITGIIKANFPARIAYQVTSKIDSRTILDMNGAEQLLGNGDMLYLPSGSPKPERIQNAFVSTEECEAIIEHIARQPGFISAYRLPIPPDKNGKTSGKKGEIEQTDDWDDMLEEAAQVIVQHNQGSTSLLQRKLKIGYSRAARIIDQLEILGIVGPPDGSKARQVMIDDPDTLNDILNIK
ncbi:MAG: DNA translocase FtsK [Bacteroidetes bacterium]|nr:DNA translocase FtsK [Bacteroidota bacterium]